MPSSFLDGSIKKRTVMVIMACNMTVTISGTGKSSSAISGATLIKMRAMKLTMPKLVEPKSVGNSYGCAW